MVKQNYTPFREIARALNIQPGDQVLLTSDILKLAIKARKEEKEFDVNAFIDSFIETIGPEGTLLIPSYNFDLENGDSYSVSETVPMTGSLAVAAMKRKDFVRTSNPMHSFLACGKDAQYLADVKNISSFGPDSPFAYLFEKNALMIFAGTSAADAMTFTHFVEESLQVRYRKYKDISIDYTDNSGKTADRKYRIYAKKYGWTMMLHLIEKVFSDDVLIRKKINGVNYSYIRCADAYEVISSDINDNKAASITVFSKGFYIRDIIKEGLQRFNLFRTTYGKIRSGKRIY